MSSPHLEIARFQKDASLHYLEASNAIYVQRGEYPAIEEIFPAPCAFIKILGRGLKFPIVFPPEREEFRQDQLTCLLTYIERAYHEAPNLLPGLLLPPQQARMTPMSNLAPLPGMEVAVSGLPQPLVYANEERPARETSRTDVPDIRERRRDIAYDVTQTLLEEVPIKIMGEALYSYTGTHYAHFTPENMRRLILGHCRDAIKSEGNSRLVNEVFNLIQCEPLIAEAPGQISHHLVSLKNGVLDLTSHRLYEHNPGYNTYYCVEATLGAKAPHPHFDRFLSSITGGSVALAQRIMEIIGYCLVPDTRGKAFIVFQGVPDSGKSVLAAFIRTCLNGDASTALDINALGGQFGTSELVGKQLCLSLDVPSNPLNAKAVGDFKRLTGGDPLTADVKYRPPITFINTAKFILATNNPILTQQDDPAFYRRAVVVPFLSSIPKDMQDFDLLTKLQSEQDAIVADALEAYWTLVANNYRFAGNFQLNEMFATIKNTGISNTEGAIATFLQSNCVYGEEFEVFVEDLYAAFVAQFGPALVPDNQFSAKVLEVCRTIGLDTVQKGQKKRKGGQGNPIARLKGIGLAYSPDQQ